jgi:LysM repeat protein
MPNRFSARWTATVTLEEGTYSFVTRSDDGVRVWVDGQRIIDDWMLHPPTTNADTVPLDRGEHEIRIEYFENAGESQVTFSWTEVGDESVAISPLSGPPGNQIQVTARGFLPNAEVAVGVRAVDARPVSSKGERSDETGLVQTTVTIPEEEAQPSQMWVAFVRADASGERGVSSTFTVTAEDVAQCEETYVVQEGDTLEFIARQCDASVAALLAANPQISPARLFPGQRLEVPSEPLDGAGAQVTATPRFYLNLRSLPTTDSEAIDLVPAGSEVPVLGHTSDEAWLLVQYRGRRGWIAGWLTDLRGRLDAAPPRGQLQIPSS